MSASSVYVSTAPGNRSAAVFRPGCGGMAMTFSYASRYTSCRIISVSCMASSAVSCAVCPSCHRNSVVRRNNRGRISHRTTLHHWL